MFRNFKCLIVFFIGYCLNVSVSQALPTSNSGQAYVNECAAAGVPIPPDWGNAKWKYKDKINDPMISTNLTAHVYYYQSTTPRGVCIALPRVSGTGEVKLLGIICQGNDTNKACFWDNSTFTLPSLTTPKPLANFNGGAGLLGQSGGECTRCHAGENAFNIVPNTATDLSALGVSTKPNDYVAPLVAQTWQQNAMPNDIAGACDVCHNKSAVGRLPKFSNEINGDGFCDSVLRHTFNNNTMPPTGAPPGNYAAHFTAFFSACELPPTTPPPQVVTLSPTQIWQVSFY